ncbi:MAG: hypothetical protein DHS20C19_25040 [Acidimicrobiales bacterium]|nr:MAG: hypothetical protein DHS20C19_25040 [Acidimicrobiales bacterium]
MSADADDLTPIEVVQVVAVPIEHAYEVFVHRIDLWWPRGHLAGGENATPVIEAAVGGRIFERGEDGREIEWGVVTEYEPPHRLSFSWHIGATAAEATQVEVQFEDGGDDTTTLHLVHSGWDRLGAAAAPRRTGNLAGWADVIPAYVGHITSSRG